MEGVNEILNKIPKENSMESGKSWTKKCPQCNDNDQDMMYWLNNSVCPSCQLLRATKRAIEKALHEIPKKYKELKTDKVKLLEENLGKSLFITGKVGAGKTVFACNLMMVLARKLQNCKYIGYSSFIMQLQSSFDKPKNSYEIAEETARFYGWLVIDDLGAEKLTPYVRQITYFIVNEREQRCLPTIITSNFSLEEIAEQIDSRISSRIAGMCKVLNFTGKDRRLDKKD